MQTSVLIIHIINKAGDHSHAWLRQYVKMSILYFRRNILSQFVWFSSAKANISKQSHGRKAATN